MRIVRHCSEHLQHGERAWRKAARLAGFTGQVYVTGLGEPQWSREQIYHDRRAHHGITIGRFAAPHTVTVLVNDSPCARGREKGVGEDRLLTFCHELYHWKLYRKRGDVFTDSVRMPIAVWRANPEERAAERYGRMLLRQALA